MVSTFAFNTLVLAPTTLAVQWPLWSIQVALLLFLFVCVLLVLTVLIQKPQGGGLAGAFGSAAGSGQTAFGAKTGDALTIFTISMFAVYILCAIGLNYIVKPITAVAPTEAVADPSTNSGTPTLPTGLTPINEVPQTPMLPQGITPMPVAPPTELPAGTAPAPTLAPVPTSVPVATPPVPAPVSPAPTDPKPADPKPADPKVP